MQLDKLAFSAVKMELDDEDAFPLDDSETTDTDGDSIGNNADADDDNNGL